jgi:hypothetical protein
MQLFGKVRHEIVLSLLALVLSSCDKNSTPAPLPANITLTAGEGIIPKVPQARYTLIPVNEGTATSTPYVMDSQTGRVWRRAIDSEHNVFTFVPVIYQNLDGARSTVPNESLTDVEFKSQAKTATQRPLTSDEAQELKSKGIDPTGYTALDAGSPTTIPVIDSPNHNKSNPATRDYILQAAKEAAIWKKLLLEVENGRPIKPLVGWNKQTGEPVYGAEVQSSDKLMESLKQNIKQCQEAIDQKNALIEQLQDKTH